MKLVFMGTPDFSVPCLAALYKAGHEIAAVFTQPDKPKGRGYVLTPPPVKVKAEEMGIPVFQPGTLRDGGALALLQSLKPELIVVVAYGKFLPAGILSLPPYGCVNVHASLLPRHRGASPIQWAIVSGDAVTGVTTMLMDEGMDTGDMLEKRETPIDPDETAAELHDRLSQMGAELICSTVAGLLDGSIRPVRQDERFATRAPLIRKEMGRIDFAKSAAEIHNLVRGFSPWPSAYTVWAGKRLKILKTRIAGSVDCLPGRVTESGGRLVVSCGGGTALELLRVQLEGAREMAASELLKGHPISEGTLFGE